MGQLPSLLKLGVGRAPGGQWVLLGCSSGGLWLGQGQGAGAGFAGDWSCCCGGVASAIRQALGCVPPAAPLAQAAALAGTGGRALSAGGHSSHLGSCADPQLPTPGFDCLCLSACAGAGADRHQDRGVARRGQGGYNSRRHIYRRGRRKAGVQLACCLLEYGSPGTAPRMPAWAARSPLADA